MNVRGKEDNFPIPSSFLQLHQSTFSSCAKKMDLMVGVPKSHMQPAWELSQAMFSSF